MIRVSVSVSHLTFGPFGFVKYIIPSPDLLRVYTYKALGVGYERKKALFNMT